MNEIFKEYPFDVPRSLVKNNLEKMKKQQGVVSGGEGKDAEEVDSDEFEKRHILESYLSTKIDILFDFLIRKNELEFSRKKLDKRLEEIAKIKDWMTDIKREIFIDQFSWEAKEIFLGKARWIKIENMLEMNNNQEPRNRTLP